MLSSLVKKHNDDLVKLREGQENRKKEAMTAATALTNAMVDHLNVGVAQAYLNEKKLDSEMRALTTNASQFAKQTHQWLALIDNFNTALKELGHVQSWGKAIEGDVRTITSALEYVYKSTQDTPVSSTGSTSGAGGGS